jgi:serine/threonine protein kinase
MQLATGTKLGPYELVSLLGAGGMGEVYRAQDTRLDRTVAIKVLPPHLSDNTEFRQRFEREARAVSSLTHPHVCTLYDVGHQDGIDYLVMEFIEGESLADRLKKGPLTIERALQCACEIAEALDKAHRAGVVHRDLKPANIMVTKSGAKLLDFGLAKFHGSQAAPATDLTSLPTERHEITSEGTILGTFQYMAPEQLEGREADPRTDIFAFGTVVYEMTTGRKAFTGRSQASLISAIMTQEPPPMMSLKPMAPPALDRVVRTCLAKDPDERWQTTYDLLLELRWLAEGTYRSDPSQASGKSSRQWLAWTIAAVAVLVALAVAISSMAGRANRSESLRFSIGTPDKALFVHNVIADFMTVSPDGRRVAFVADSDGRTTLWVRPLDSLNAHLLAGTEGAFTFLVARQPLHRILRGR